MRRAYSGVKTMTAIHDRRRADYRVPGTSAHSRRARAASSDKSPIRALFNSADVRPIVITLTPKCRRHSIAARRHTLIYLLPFLIYARRRLPLPPRDGHATDAGLTRAKARILAALRHMAAALSIPMELLTQAARKKTAF